MKPKAIHLTDAIKQYQHDQDKVMSPSQTVSRLKKRLDQLDLDILARAVRIDNGRLDIPVYFSTCGADAHAVIGTEKQMGKGATPAQSEASAVMELAERFSLFSFTKSSEPFVTATANELGQPLLPFAEVAKSVNDDSADLQVAEAFYADLPMRWTWAYDMMDGQSVMVPFTWFWTINEFNGASAGNCNEEALTQGLCEVVERHVSSLICHGRLKVPQIPLASVADPVANELLAKYEAAGVKVFLSDFTLEMGIPSIGALAYDPSTFPKKSEIVWTAGTMPAANKALCRALTEVAQLAGDFNTSTNYVASGLPKFTRLEQADYVIDPGQTIDLASLPDLSDNNIRIEVENLISALADRQMRALVIDIRNPLLDVPAFYTIIPGADFRERSRQASVAMMVAKIMTETMDADTAIARLEKMEAALPGKYFIQFFLGQAHLQMGRAEIAASHLQRAMDLNPPAEDLASVYSYLSVCLKEMGRFEEALKLTADGLRIDDERTDLWNLKGFCHFKLGQHEQAIECFEALIRLNPSSAIDYANIASNHRAMGNNDKAVDYYRLALELDPGIDFARDHLAQLGASPAS